MKITKTQLRKIIKEELAKVISENVSAIPQGYPLEELTQEAIDTYGNAMRESSYLSYERQLREWVVTYISQKSHDSNRMKYYLGGANTQEMDQLRPARKAVRDHVMAAVQQAVEGAEGG